MTVLISPVYTGITSNDGTGDTIQTAFIKVNNSFTNVATAVSALQANYANTQFGVFSNLTVTNQVLGSLNFFGGNTIYINGSPVATSASSFSGGYVANQATFGANLVANSATSSGNVSTGALVVVGGAGVSGNINVGGNISVASVLDSSSTNIGSIVTAGGLGVARNVNFGAALSVATSIGVTGPLTASSASITAGTASTGTNTGALIVTGGVGIGGALNVGGNVTITNLTVTGNLTAYTSGVITSSVIDLNTPVSLAPLTQQTTSNIGTVFHYYDSAGAGDSHAFAGRLITGIGSLSNAFAYYSSVAYSDSGGGSPVGTQLGTIAGGSLIAANTTPSTSTTSGALLVSGGAGIAGNVFAGNVSATGFFFANGTPFNYGNVQMTANLSSFAGNFIPSANLTYNLGSTSSWWNNVYGTSVHAQYADLAENYLTDQIYEPGTVVVVGGSAEVTACTDQGQDNVIGAVSTDPAYLMNGAAGGQPIALKGRIPLKVFGPILKGQRLGTSHEPGHAEYAAGRYSFAIALETDISLGTKIIEAIIL
jgi:cytoskeletal protein CcmA (bactofilin family)